MKTFQSKKLLSLNSLNVHQICKTTDNWGYVEAL